MRVPMYHTLNLWGLMFVFCSVLFGCQVSRAIAPTDQFKSMGDLNMTNELPLLDQLRTVTQQTDRNRRAALLQHLVENADLRALAVAERRLAQHRLDLLPRPTSH